MDRIVWQGEPTVLASLSFTVGIALGIASIVLIAFLSGSPSWWVQVLTLSAAVLMVTFGFYHGRSITYIISEHGVSRECHYIADEYNELPFDKIAAVVVSQGIWGRLLSFGTVVVRSGSVSFQSILFKGIKQPERVRQIVLDAKERFSTNCQTKW